MVVNISNLHFSYAKRKVFAGLNLRLQSGCIYGLLGRNGTGKSTLLRSIAGLLFPGEGSINVSGFNPSMRTPDFLRNIFMLPEELYMPDIGVSDILKYQAPFYPRFNYTQFAKYIDEFEIPRTNTLQQMSYGQMKKVLISFCLASNVSLMLMDEPTNGLDIISKSQFRRVIAGALDEDKCIIISTHQVKDLESLIDRVMIIEDGRIIFDQTISEISRKLSFKISSDSVEVKQSLYSEHSLMGNAIVIANDGSDESNLDLELLYKATVTNPVMVQGIFNH